MGYHTEFEGQFELDKKLEDNHFEYLMKFSKTRRMKRNAFKAELLPDDTRKAVNLPIGEEGEYFVGGSGYASQDSDISVVNNNSPPAKQPGLWCQWVPNAKGTTIKWDGGEKFYLYVDWLEYLIKHFFVPWGYTLNGQVRWRGEDFNDMGTIVVVNNKVTTTVF